jgi:O-Antigen ligase
VIETDNRRYRAPAMEGATNLTRDVDLGGQGIVPLLRRPGYAGWLLALVLACSAYAVFASGATSIPEDSRVQVGIAVAVLLAGLGLASGELGAARSPLAWAGAAMLAFYALFSAISVAWSIAPDLGWLAANRAAEYAAVVAVLLVAAPSVRRAPELAVAALSALALAAVLYALAGKLIPTISIGPVHFDEASEFARLRAPIGYWNALGLLLVIGAPGCIWAAADRDRGPRLRIAALLTLQLLAVGIALTLSRGAVLAFLVVLAVMIGAGPDRLGRLGAACLALLGAAPAIAFDFIRDNLHDNGVAASDRAADGILLAFILAVSMLALVGAALWALSAEEIGDWDPDDDWTARRAVTGLAAVLAVAGVIALAASDRGPIGTISHAWSDFKQPSTALPNTPNRLVSSSGSNRWTWWGEALGAFSDRPIAGWGAGSFPILHDRYRRVGTQVQSTHDVPLQFLTEGGLIAAILGLSALGLLGAAAVTTYREASGPDRGARLVLLAVAAAWAVHSLYDWDWEIPAVTLPALAALAVAASPRWGGRDWLDPPMGGRSSPGLGPVPIAAAAAVLAVALIGSSVLPAVSQRRRLDAEVSAATAHTQAAIEDSLSDALLAHKLNPLDVESLFTAAHLERRLGRTQKEVELLLDAAAIQPDNHRVWEALIDTGRVDVGRIATHKVIATEPLTIDQNPAAAGAIGYTIQVPPERSPTAFGTPPPAQ